MSVTETNRFGYLPALSMRSAFHFVLVPLMTLLIMGCEGIIGESGCPYMPLSVGAEWVYNCTVNDNGTVTNATTTVTVVEQEGETYTLAVRSVEKQTGKTEHDDESAENGKAVADYTFQAVASNGSLFRLANGNRNLVLNSSEWKRPANTFLRGYSGWDFILRGDKSITVPYGTFSCLSIESNQGVWVGQTPRVKESIEYFAKNVGLVYCRYKLQSAVHFGSYHFYNEYPETFELVSYTHGKSDNFSIIHILIKFFQ